MVHPADLCFKLPDNVSLEEGAMCEPLSVGLHACRRANVGPETNLLIMGAGPIGLVMMLAARAFGAPRIVIVDVDNYRLSVAKELGADQFVKVSTRIQVPSTASLSPLLLNIVVFFFCPFFFGKRRIDALRKQEPITITKSNHPASMEKSQPTQNLVLLGL